MDQKSGKPSQKRRAILQGSLAAPVVLTVSSASAQMVSSHMKCAGNIVQPTNAELQNNMFFVDEQRSLSTADNWLRAQVSVKLFQKGNDPSAFFFFDPALNDHVRVSDLMKLGDLNGWQEVKGAATETRWALVWVDKTLGKPYSRIQVQKPTSDYQLTTESCNASINPTIRL